MLQMLLLEELILVKVILIKAAQQQLIVAKIIIKFKTDKAQLAHIQMQLEHIIR